MLATIVLISNVLKEEDDSEGEENSGSEERVVTVNDMSALVPEQDSELLF